MQAAAPTPLMSHADNTIVKRIFLNSIHKGTIKVITCSRNTIKNIRLFQSDGFHRITKHWGDQRASKGDVKIA
jgi:hypothetical protein